MEPIMYSPISRITQVARAILPNEPRAIITALLFFSLLILQSAQLIDLSAHPVKREANHGVEKYQTPTLFQTTYLKRNMTPFNQSSDGGDYYSLSARARNK